MRVQWKCGASGIKKSVNAQSRNGVYPHIAPTMLLADGVNSAAAQPAI